MNGQRSAELFAEAQPAIPGVNSPVRAADAAQDAPRCIERASGPYLWNADGQRYIDYVLSWGPMILGHAHPLVVAALHEGIQLGASYGAPTALETELAQLIIEALPSAV
jgi:glutamate-1-semialdehyde 2,1-aminomutase